MALMLASSCELSVSLPDGKQEDLDLTHECSFVVRDFEWEGSTRTCADISEQGVSFVWEVSDTIGVYPDKGAQIEFVIDETNLVLSTAFNGGAWAFREGHTYTAFHPFDYNNHTSKNILIDYTGQVQTGVDDTKSVGRKDYIYASPTTPQEGQTDFTFKHVGAFLWLKLDLPCSEPLSITSISLVAGSECIPTKLSLDISTDPITVKTVETSDRLEIGLSDITFHTEGSQINIYAMLPPIDTTNMSFEVWAEDALGNQYKNEESLLFDQGLQPGVAYQKEANLQTVQQE